MPSPGVYPPGPPPPGWPSPFPPITIGPNGNPTYSSSEPTSTDTTSSSSCTSTETASSCIVSTSYGIDTAGSTTTTFTTTSCSTITGCSVSGTTSTTVTSSSATPGCWKFPVVTAAPTPAPSAAFAKRQEGSDMEHDAMNPDEGLLAKRAKNSNRDYVRKFGTVCNLNQPIKVPDHWGPAHLPQEMANRGTPIAGAYIVPLDTANVCAPPQLTLLSDLSQLSSTKYYDGQQFYIAMGTPANGKVPYVNTEHVCEY